MKKDLIFDTGSITLHVQGNPDRPLTFNPTDYNMAAKFYELIQSAEEKQKEFTERAKIADTSNDPKEVIKLLGELDVFFREELDKVFGTGSAILIFEDVNVASKAQNGDMVIANFLMALYPYFEKASDKKVDSIIQDHKPKKKK